MQVGPRDSIRLQQNRQGVVDPNVTSEDLYQRALECIVWGDEPRKGLEGFWENERIDRPKLYEWKASGGDLRRIRILDSFFSDTLYDPDIRPHIFRRALSGVRVEFLLADPQGSFGVSRAGAIGQEALGRSAEGLKKLALTCNSERVKANRKSVVSEAEIRQCDPDKDWSKIAGLLIKVFEGLPIEVRLYEKSPSGPYYFFGDMLLAGRFWSGNTAAFYPWSQITDTPYANDLYDTMLAEFYELWESATPIENVIAGDGGTRRERRGKNVFISYCRDDEETAKEIEKRLKQRGLQTYRYQSDLEQGQSWPDELKAHLRASDSLVAVVSSTVLADKEWIRAEVGAAWVLGKRIFQAKLGIKKEESILPGILGPIWSDKIGSSEGMNALIEAVVGGDSSSPRKDGLAHE